MAKSHKYILYTHHDRHVEDTHETYPYNEENWELAKEKCRRDWGTETPGFASTGKGYVEIESANLYKWTWDGSDSYYSTVEVVNKLRKPKLPSYNKNG